MGRIQSRPIRGPEHQEVIGRRRRRRRRQSQVGCMETVRGCLGGNRSSSEQQLNNETLQSEQPQRPPRFVIRLAGIRRYFRRNRNRNRNPSRQSSAETLQSGHRPRQRRVRIMYTLATLGCIDGNRLSASSHEMSDFHPQREQSRSSAEDLIEPLNPGSSREASSDHEGHDSEESGQRSQRSNSGALGKKSAGSSRSSNRSSNRSSRISSREILKSGSASSVRERTSEGVHFAPTNKSDFLLKLSIEDSKLKNRGKEARSVSSDNFLIKNKVSPGTKIFRSRGDVCSLNNLTSAAIRAREPIIHDMSDFNAITFRNERELQKKSGVKRPIIYRSSRARSSSERNIIRKEEPNNEDIKNKGHECEPLDAIIHKRSKKLKFVTNKDGKTVIIDPQNPEDQRFILLEEKLQWGSNKEEQNIRKSEVPKSKAKEPIQRIDSDKELLRRVTRDFSWKKMWRTTLKAPRRKLHLLWLKFRASRVRHPSDPWHLEPIVVWRRGVGREPVRVPRRAASESCLLTRPPPIALARRAATFDTAVLNRETYFSYYYPYIGQTKTFGYSTSSAFRDVVIGKKSSPSNSGIQFSGSSRRQNLSLPIISDMQSLSRSGTSTTQNVSRPGTSGIQSSSSQPSTSRSYPSDLQLPEVFKSSVYRASRDGLGESTSKGENKEYKKFWLDSPITEVDEEYSEDSDGDPLSTSV